MTIDDDIKTVEHIATFGDMSDYAEAINRVLAELRRLRSALPRTADGVRVAPTQAVYVRLEDGSGIKKDYVRCCLCTYDAYEVNEAYASRAAALDDGGKG
jgi:hypothetical protein